MDIDQIMLEDMSALKKFKGKNKIRADIISLSFGRLFLSFVDYLSMHQGSCCVLLVTEHLLPLMIEGNQLLLVSKNLLMRLRSLSRTRTVFCPETSENISRSSFLLYPPLSYVTF